MITFEENSRIIRIDTKNSTYAMQISHEKYVLHLYYGKRTEYIEPYQERVVSFAPYVADIGVNFSLDTVPTELSFFGSGDLRDTGIKIKNQNGDSTTLFKFENFRIFKGRIQFQDMPYSRNGDETLEITYFDEVSNCRLKSYYTVYYETDTITRYIIFENVGKNNLLIENAIGCQLDFENAEFDFTCLAGEYMHERNITSYPLHFGKQSIYSERGHSSAQANPFLMLKRSDCKENVGECYALEFVYSGDFEIQAELSYDKKLRVLAGLNRHTFAWNLKHGQSFTSPEVILSYSDKGINGLTQQLHDHIRNNIINPKFVYKKRPVVINTWEAVYFNINEDILLEFVDKAIEMGIDTLVIDDGWFGQRNNDTLGLGDWYVNKDKFKNGLKAFSEIVHRKGINLGIWIEPEMINPNSNLYRAHPEWALQCKDRQNSLGRNQLVLDLTNYEAVEYVVEQIKTTLKDVRLEYIKWDFNRSLSEVGSLFLDKEQQCEAKHRFVLGCYKMHQMLTDAFPDVIFEGCSGGGGRFDCGILFYCPQIWTSDNTDPVARLAIQQGTSLAYPLSTMSAHVADRLKNTFETEPDYDFRFNVALGGVLGYEMNITRFNPQQINQVREQIDKYRDLDDLILKGDMYYLENLDENEYGFYVVSKDKSKFYLEYFSLDAIEEKTVNMFGLKEKSVYTDIFNNTLPFDFTERSFTFHLKSKNNYSYYQVIAKLKDNCNEQ